MAKLIETISVQRTEILQALGQHLAISLISLVIAVLIAVPLAISLRDRPFLGEAGLQVAGIIQTIPSLALLGLLIPLVGIGTVPAVIALTLYAIMPIYQNTYAGLKNVDPNLKEAAQAFGLSRFKQLQRLEFPLALPLILSGIRIALVMVIGTATLAAFIGAGGLGSYIMLGIQQNNNDYLLIGGILSAALAFICSGLLKFIGKNSRRIYITLALLALLGAGVGGVKVYETLQPKPVKVVIAGKLGSEPEILMNMYKELIKQADPKAEVTLKPNFGGTTFLFKALQKGQIDIYPEFTGTVLEALVDHDKKTPSDPKETYTLAQKQLSKQYDLRYLKPMAYQNGYDLAVTKEFSQKYNVTKLSDLARVNAKVHAGFDPDFSNQEDGYLGLKQVYDLDFGKVSVMEPALRYQAIAQKKVNLVDGYTTDPQVRQYDLVVLKDDKNFFPPYQGAPLMNEKFAQANPKIVQSLEKLAGKITAEEMQEMNYEVSVKHQKASVVAHKYLVEHGLLK
ncbi:MAG: ABC transporter permease/substrate-binding protein [Ligilactobacillus murinus]|nr:ABC transporter permease/substrate-binding protein [Ligilactobacillus murinus]